MTLCYRIKDWKKHFEKAQTRGVKIVTWVPLPNKHDGKGFRRLIRHENGEGMLGAWTMITQIASKCPIRGTLVDTEFQPITAMDMADKTGARELVFQEALNLLCSQQIGWMEQVEITPEMIAAINASQRVATTGQDMEGQDKTGQLHPPDVCPEPSADDSKQPSAGEKSSATAEVIMVFPCVGRGPTEWPLVASKVEEYRQSFPAVDVLGECRKARQWCVDNRQKRKTFTGMPAFLSRWLSKCQDAGGNGSRNGSASAHCEDSLKAYQAACRARRTFGTTERRHFEDPIIPLVIDELGGWPKFCILQESDAPFYQKRFEAAYRRLKEGSGSQSYATQRT